MLSLNTKKYTYLWALLGCLLWTTAASALEVKAVGQTEYKGRLDKSERRNAENQALIKAVETWVSEQQKSNYRNYQKVKADIDANIEDYVLSHSVVSEDKDSDTRKFRVVVRAKLNETKLLNKLLSSSEPVSEDDQEYITFVFVARQQTAMTRQSSKVAEQSKEEIKGMGKTDDGDNVQMSKKQTRRSEVKDSQTFTTDQISWNVTTANEVNVAMGDVFTDANYLVIDADMLEEETGYLLEVENFIRDYQYGDDLKSATKRDALKGLKRLEDPVQYLAIGTLDIDQQLTDEVTGLIKVPVSVTGQVLSVKRRGAAMAKVGPVQYFGTGPTYTVAKNNALKLAAKQAATALVAKLSSKNIR